MKEPEGTQIAILHNKGDTDDKECETISTRRATTKEVVDEDYDERRKRTRRTLTVL